jgi:hypothetical protein
MRHTRGLDEFLIVGPQTGDLDIRYGTGARTRA